VRCLEYWIGQVRLSFHYLYRLISKLVPGTGGGEGDATDTVVDEDQSLEADDTSADEDAPVSGGKIPLKLRFKAWWDGHDLQAELEKAQGTEDIAKVVADNPASKPAAAVEAGKPKILWPSERLRLAQEIWGAGYVSPAGDEYILDLIKPFALNPKLSLLEIGAGLGGSARAIADKFDLWVTAFEAEPLLVEKGIEQATKVGMEKRAALSLFDPEHPDLKKKRYDCILAREAFFTVMNKSAALKTLLEGIKSKGQVLITDFMLPEGGQLTSGVKSWCESEPVPPVLWQVSQMRSALKKLGFDIRIEEDVTKGYRQRLFSGWASLVGSLRREDFMDEGRYSGKKGMLMVKEAEFWLNRDKILSTGELGVFRFHAFKKTDAL